MKNVQLFSDFAGSIPVRFTTHAIERLWESQANVVTGKQYLYSSIRYPIKPNWKNKKYTDNKRNTTYWIYNTIVFCVVKKKDERNMNKDIYLVTTVFDNRYYLR